MGDVLDTTDKIKKYYKFTKHEIKGMIISILILAFVISFRDWGATSFNPFVGTFNLFNSILIVTLSFLVHDTGQRLLGLIIGYKIEYKMFTYGLAAALIIAFATNGRFWLLVPGSFLIHHMPGHRLGYFRYGINYFGQAMVAFAGPLFTLILIIILKILNVAAPSILIEKAILFNVIYLITSMIPIPPLDGSRIYWGSRMLYMFVTPAIIAATILLIVDIPVFFSLLLSLLIGISLWIVYYMSFERKVWKGP
jgi:hypothetical protein